MPPYFFECREKLVLGHALFYRGKIRKIRIFNYGLIWRHGCLWWQFLTPEIDSRWLEIHKMDSLPDWATPFSTVEIFIYFPKFIKFYKPTETIYEFMRLCIIIFKCNSTSSSLGVAICHLWVICGHLGVVWCHLGVVKGHLRILCGHFWGVYCRFAVVWNHLGVVWGNFRVV